MSEQIKIRNFREPDSSLIFDSWSKGVYYAGVEPILTPSNIWFNQFHQYVKDSIAHDQIWIACLQSDPNMIVGYAVFKGGMLDFVYVKELFRKQGIGRLLLSDKVKSVNPLHITRIGKNLLHKLHLEDKNEG